MTKISHLLNPLTLATTTVVSSLILVHAAPAGAVNLVQNGNFETGDFTSWTVGGPFVFVGRGVNGTQNALLGFGSNNFISQTISTTVGQNYSLSYDLYVDSSSPNRFQVNVNGVTLFDQSNIPATPLAFPFPNYSFNFVGTGSDTLRFDVTSIEPFQLDNVVVDIAASTAVPEPFTIIGTLVGGTAAIRMRKKLKLDRSNDAIDRN